MACVAVGILMAEATIPPGYSSRDLADAVRSEYSPKTSAFLNNASKWLSDNRYPQNLVPLAWWGADAPSDIFNVIWGPPELAQARCGYIPGYVSEVSANGADWAVGTGRIGSETVNMWQIAPDRRGDLARRFMYMALIYPNALWRGEGCMIFADGSWPLLTPYGMELLLQWHRADPVSDTELAECAEIAAIQGASNPFVDFPDLAEYLWGVNSSQAWVGDDQPETPPEKDPGDASCTPIKKQYSKSVDDAIWLTSPYVDSTARWYFDGHTVNEAYVELNEVSVGRHELSFESAAGRGSLIIFIEP